MKTYILAFKSSLEAKNLTEYAIEIAKNAHAKLVLFHLHNPSIHSINARLPYQSILKSIEHYKTDMDVMVQTLSQNYDMEISLDFAMGDFFEQITRSIEEHHADLVIMGMHEKSLEDDLLGSTTTAAIHRLKVPVLAIPEIAEFHGLKKILFAFDIKKGIPKDVLNRIENVAETFHAELEIFYVNDDSKTSTLNLENKIRELSQSFSNITYSFKSVNSNTVIQEINKELESFKADLLVMVPYEYGFWSSLVHKSKTRIMASGLQVPLLSVHSFEAV